MSIRYDLGEEVEQGRVVGYGLIYRAHGDEIRIRLGACSFVEAIEKGHVIAHSLSDHPQYAIICPIVKQERIRDK